MAEVIYEKHQNIAKIWLNRPERENQFTSEMSAQLLAAFGQARDDDDVRVVIARANGTDFRNGCDLAGPSLIIAADGKDVPFLTRRKDTQRDVDYWTG